MAEGYVNKDMALVGTYTPASYGTGYSAFGSQNDTLKIMVYSNGLKHLDGLFTVTDGSGETVFTLPPEAYKTALGGAMQHWLFAKNVYTNENRAIRIGDNGTKGLKWDSNFTAGTWLIDTWYL